MNIKKSIKNSAKKIIQDCMLTDEAPVVIASMGRAGSTLLHKAVCEGMAKKRFKSSKYPLPQLVAGYAWDLASTDLKQGVIYKTHALATEMPNVLNAKVIFVYGSPIESVKSVIEMGNAKGASWLAKHFKNLFAEGQNVNILTSDALRFEEQVDGWTQLSSHRLLAVKYEKIWEHQVEIAEFLGYDIELPKQRPRRQKTIDHETNCQLINTYGLLEKKITNMPSIIVK